MAGEQKHPLFKLSQPWDATLRVQSYPTQEWWLPTATTVSFAGYEQPGRLLKVKEHSHLPISEIWTQEPKNGSQFSDLQSDTRAQTVTHTKEPPPQHTHIPICCLSTAWNPLDVKTEWGLRLSVHHLSVTTDVSPPRLGEHLSHICQTVEVSSASLTLQSSF